MDEHRFPPDSAIAGTGVVTYRKGQETGYWSFGNYGNVVVYRPDGGDGTPIIHRARFYVEEGDDWVAMANDAYLGGVDTCAETMTCPAPHDGFITKGDNNGEYDQVGGQSTVVEPSWVTGRAKVRIPWLGYVRLWFGSSAPLGSATAPTGIAGVIGAIVTRLELAIAALAGIQVARTIG
jgi:signal peptidase